MKPVARDTLVGFFHDLARATGEFLVYDDGVQSARRLTFWHVWAAIVGAKLVPIGQDVPTPERFEPLSRAELS